MANRSMANKRLRSARQFRAIAGEQSLCHIIEASNRGWANDKMVPAYDGSMVEVCEAGTARGLSIDVGRMGKARATATRNTFGDDTRKVIDVMDCVSRVQTWPIVTGVKPRRHK
jgi:hypothetical protein